MLFYTLNNDSSVKQAYGVNHTPGGCNPIAALQWPSSGFILNPPGNTPPNTKEESGVQFVSETYTTREASCEMKTSIYSTTFVMSLL